MDKQIYNMINDLIIYTDKEKPIKEALEQMTDEWIGEWRACDQTIMDMRDCLKVILGLINKSEK